jgi:hypothetical protein
MKKTMILACFAMVLATPKARAQHKNAIKLNYLSAALLTFNGAYERVILPKTGLQLGGYYTSLRFADVNYVGYGITPELRYYPGDENDLEGFFIAPFLRYQNFELAEEISGVRNKATLTMLGGGVVLGGKWQSDHICFDIFAGPVFKNAEYKQTTGTDDIDFRLGGSGVGIRFGTTVGIVF